MKRRLLLIPILLVILSGCDNAYPDTPKGIAWAKHFREGCVKAGGVISVGDFSNDLFCDMSGAK